MRVRIGVRIGLVALLAMAVALPAQVAAADGGAFIDFGGTFFTPGGGSNGTASGTAFVFVPRPEQDILDRGPFYAYLMPYGPTLREGEPIPQNAIRVGTFSISHRRGKVFVLRISFAVPEVKTGTYGVHLCNDPCTVAGFREPLNGVITIAATAGEAKLARQLYEARWNISWFQGRLERLKDARVQLEAELEASARAHTELELDLEELRAAKSRTALAQSDQAGRPLVEAWALVAIAIAVLVSLVAVTLGIVFSRRHRPTLVVPDTIAELDEERADTLART